MEITISWGVDKKPSNDNQGQTVLWQKYRVGYLTYFRGIERAAQRMEHSIWDKAFSGNGGRVERLLGRGCRFHKAVFFTVVFSGPWSLLDSWKTPKTFKVSKWGRICESWRPFRDRSFTGTESLVWLNCRVQGEMSLERHPVASWKWSLWIMQIIFTLSKEKGKARWA